MQTTNIILQQPQPFDLVDRTILIAGYGVGFEGSLSIYIGDGHYEVETYAQVGATSLKQFQTKVEIPEDINFKLDRIGLVVTDDTAGCEEAPCPTVFVPLIFAPRILENYTGFWFYTVQEGDTLSTLAHNFYGNNQKWKVIYRSNIDVIENPDIIYPAQVLKIPRND